MHTVDIAVPYEWSLELASVDERSCDVFVHLFSHLNIPRIVHTFINNLNHLLMIYQRHPFHQMPTCSLQLLANTWEENIVDAVTSHDRGWSLEIDLLRSISRNALVLFSLHHSLCLNTPRIVHIFTNPANLFLSILPILTYFLQLLSCSGSM